MDWLIPGTTLKINRSHAGRVNEMFTSMFMAGDMVLGQISNVTGLEAYTIQNWVKRGFLPPPDHKRYTMNQLCRIISIGMLKSILSMETIYALLGYVNGALDKEEDDIIDDATLYFLFVRLAANARQLDDPKLLEQALSDVMSDYAEPVPGAKKRIEKALQIMLVAWVAAQIQQKAEEMFREL